MQLAVLLLAQAAQELLHRSSQLLLPGIELPLALS
jgi:hypothetical protein